MTDEPMVERLTDGLTELEWDIVHDLQDLAPALRDLGHAHARLDANARVLIARTVAKRFAALLSQLREQRDALERGPEWHVERFPTATVEHVALKLAEEAGEVCAAVIAMSGNEHPERAASVVDECADVFIVLSVLVGRYFPFTPLMEAVRTKLDALAALAPDTEGEGT